MGKLAGLPFATFIDFAVPFALLSLTQMDRSWIFHSALNNKCFRRRHAALRKQNCPLMPQILKITTRRQIWFFANDRRNGLYGHQFTICLWWGWAWAFRGCIDFGRASKNFVAVAFPVFEASFGPALAIAHFAPKALQQRILPQVCSGEMVVAISMSEPNAGTALTDLKTRGKLSGDKIILNGSKRWCSGGVMLMPMLFIAACLMIRGQGYWRSIGRKRYPGVYLWSPRITHGWRGIASADMYFDNVKVPAENIIVPAGGFKKLMEAFDLERCGNTTMSLACGQSAFDYALHYVQEREQFGKPIIEFQAVQLQIAQMKMKLDAARLLLYRAVNNAEQALPSIADSSIAKCYANEIARDVASAAVQLMGGYGYSKSYPMEQKMRDAWGWGIAGGAIDIQKVNIAAALTGKRFNQRG